MKLAIALLILMTAPLVAQMEPIAEVFTHVPWKARLKPNPLASDPNARAAGQKLFRQYCAQCHGASAEGTKGAPMLVGGVMVDAKPGELFWIVTNGVVRKGMPSWSVLPPPQRWQIVTFLESLNKP
jgi:cytochrome c oxidase cbb3-type subunit 3